MTDNRIAGRLVLITGASGGIGSACAKRLHAQGADLALTYSSNGSSVDSLVSSLNSSEPQKCSSHKVDVSLESDLYRLFEEIKEVHGRHPDILISNAGYGKRISDIVDIPIEEFDKMIAINLRPSFILSKLCVPSMTTNKWGRIIFISSIAAIGGGINGAHYATSKAGLTGMMKNLAQKLAKDGITVNDVSPAMIGDTGMIRDAKAVEGTPGDIKNIPVGRLGTPEECANVVNMLCETGYLTGQSILLSGGLK
ncbi:NAD(P)-binding protein [Myriangium duriaei CBS 260.36]|uniref:NAD(P)-binding protein n=1 Tax=Myriangium duriaei CBS 260.36 TaxID=1168546 RepID=A0A9P4J8Z9_9PEZI|nr:NAD(P)-binding protein [Myriangium duriaei CBS 260.36]